MFPYIHTYIHTYIHACMHAHMHACMHMHTHIHTYTYHRPIYLNRYVFNSLLNDGTDVSWECHQLLKTFDHLI